jgi:hypothetical protein
VIITLTPGHILTRNGRCDPARDPERGCQLWARPEVLLLDPASEDGGLGGRLLDGRGRGGGETLERDSGMTVHFAGDEE